MTIPEPIESFLLRLGFDYEILPSNQPPGSRSDGRRDEASAVTEVFISGHTPVLAMHARHRRVRRERLQQIAEVATLREATRDEIAQIYPFADPGAVPPLGPLYGHPVFVDEELAAHDDVIFAAGTSSEVIRMKYRDFAALVHPVVGSFTESLAGASAGRPS